MHSGFSFDPAASMNVAIIGGGYAGMAAAVALAEKAVPVTVFEAAKTLGGRARRVEHRDLALDNGLHILVGAYGETLRLMRTTVATQLAEVYPQFAARVFGVGAAANADA